MTASMIRDFDIHSRTGACSRRLKGYIPTIGGSKPPPYKKLIFTVGAIHESPVFFRHSHNKNPVCHPERRKTQSGLRSRSFVEGVSRSRRRSDTKPRSERDDGISKRTWVACHNECNIPSRSHQDSLRDPASTLRSRAFTSLLAR